MAGGPATATRTAGRPTAELRALPIRPEALARLLDRRGVDGELVQADPALTRAAVEAARAEVRRVAALLAGYAADQRALERPQIAAMTAALVYLKGVIEGLEAAMGGLIG